MSDPARDFQKLNLDDMPVTRSHNRPPQQVRGRERLPSESARMNPLSRPPRPQPSSSTVQSGSQTSRMQTASASISRTLTPSVAQAQALFKVEGIVTEDTHIDFRLRPLDDQGGQVVERIFYDSAHRNHSAACSQVEHQRLQTPCNHIQVRLHDRR